MIEILRLSHRLPRDCRITTHVALSARAFGATAMHYSGMHDQEMEDAVHKITLRFGGTFTTHYITNEQSFLKQKKKEGYTLIHLTVYGTSFQELPQEQTNDKILLIVGGEKVPPYIYHLSDYNISVVNQPYSEVAALSLVLYHIHGIETDYAHAQRRIIGQKRGKKIETFVKEQSIDLVEIPDLTKDFQQRPKEQ